MRYRVALLLWFYWLSVPSGQRVVVWCRTALGRQKYKKPLRLPSAETRFFGPTARQRNYEQLAKGQVGADAN